MLGNGGRWPVGHFEVLELETSWCGRVGRGDGGYPCPHKGAEEVSASAILRLRS